MHQSKAIFSLTEFSKASCKMVQLQRHKVPVHNAKDNHQVLTSKAITIT